MLAFTVVMVRHQAVPLFPGHVWTYIIYFILSSPSKALAFFPLSTLSLPPWFAPCCSHLYVVDIFSRRLLCLLPSNHFLFLLFVAISLRATIYLVSLKLRTCQHFFTFSKASRPDSGCSTAIGNRSSYLNFRHAIYNMQMLRKYQSGTNLA